MRRTAGLEAGLAENTCISTGASLLLTCLPGSEIPGENSLKLLEVLLQFILDCVWRYFLVSQRRGAPGI